MTRPSMLRLRHLDGREFASNILGEHGVSAFGVWGWVVDCVCFEFECCDDEVDCVETDDGDVITARGEHVARQITEHGHVGRL